MKNIKPIFRPVKFADSMDLVSRSEANTYATVQTAAQSFLDLSVIAGNAAMITQIDKQDLYDDPLGKAVFALSICSIVLHFIAFVLMVVIATAQVGFDKDEEPDEERNTRVGAFISVLNAVVTLIVGFSLIVNVVGNSLASALDLNINHVLLAANSTASATVTPQPIQTTTTAT